MHPSNLRWSYSFLAQELPDLEATGQEPVERKHTVYFVYLQKQELWVAYDQEQPFNAVQGTTPKVALSRLLDQLALTPLQTPLDSEDEVTLTTLESLAMVFKEKVKLSDLHLTADNKGMPVGDMWVKKADS